MKQSFTLPEAIKDWTPDQFMALLLLHAAHADLDYTDDERHKILEYISESELTQLEAYYRDKTDAQILQIILNHKTQFLSTELACNSILQGIRSIFEADGEISKLEQTQYQFLRRIILDTVS